MNPYQKLAVFLFRTLGVVMAWIGASSPLSYAVHRALGLEYLALAAASKGPGWWIASLLWGITGVLLLTFAKSLGRLIGRGLD